MDTKKLLHKFKFTSKWSIAGFFLGAAGFGLGLGVNPWFLILSILACFVLPLLRLLGILTDWDEFQIISLKKAAVVSYTVTGIFIFSIAITGKTGLLEWDMNSIIMNLMPVTIMSYYLAYFFQFWDGLKAGRLISVFIFFFWLLFTVLSAFGENHGFTSFVMQSLVVWIPLVITYIISYYFPLISGILMLGVFVFHFIFFDAYNQPSVAFLLPVPELIIGLGYIKHFRTCSREGINPQQ
jgi:hypothetical protein